MSSPHPWDPTNVKFCNNARSLGEEITEVRGINAIEVKNITPHISDSIITHDKTVSVVTRKRNLSGLKESNPPLQKHPLK